MERVDPGSFETRIPARRITHFPRVDRIKPITVGNGLITTLPGFMLLKGT